MNLISVLADTFDISPSWIHFREKIQTGILKAITFRRLFSNRMHSSGQKTQEAQVCHLDVTSLLSVARPRRQNFRKETGCSKEVECGVRT